MAGLIKAEDIALVKERTAIDEVVAEHVTLRSAGPGSMKGLCPFHDEKTPSFYVRPAVGAYNCFGCGKGGDVISFVMEMEHLTFAESVERLAAKSGIELHYEEGAGPRRESVGQRTRLLEAHRVAQEFYAEALLSAAEARTARDFLRARGFTGATIKPFGVGYAPRGGEELAKLLRDKGFTPEELTLSGLVGQGRRGLYDRFRGRVVWPIRDVTGDTIGFGARRIFDDDRIEAKYLNTAETPLYKKTQVLYGLDLAKRDIAKDRKVVVVEGYTDVMACHLAGVPHAVATCGTSFGADHVKALRRLIRDEADQAPGKVIFTFDGDAAGQKAALRAFELDGMWSAQSFVAVAADGKDPCDLRQSDGNEAVVQLVDSATRLFDFVLRTTLSRFDLASPEGRVAGMRAIAPVLKGIRDEALREQYVHESAGRLGMPVDRVTAEVARATPAAARPERQRRQVEEEAAPEPGIRLPDGRDPRVRAEQQLLACALQYPGAVPGVELKELQAADFGERAHGAIFAALMGVGDPAGRSMQGWSDAVRQAAPEVLREYVARLSVTPLPVRLEGNGLPDSRYAASLIRDVRINALRRQIQEVTAELLQASDRPEDSRRIGIQLQDLQRQLARLTSQAS
ncbi:DNA primase [Calidifontibacter sp. DB0510]|uniref:DNA primase n=1 Tax=Metallococcus carri TaxID=1656884 RepID=A0A967B247_9MICO|nr:DNA primase [Metallococcus carri]NHN57441.1 DNA primase [Metallococcus carri]NOP39163.1 DNA primase [Calidifontibacter sp. DB2511S]